MSERHPDLACRKVVDMVTDYLDGELVPADRAQLEQHVLICQACMQFIAQNRLTSAGLRALTAQPRASDARTSVMAAFRSMRRGSER